MRAGADTPGAGSRPRPQELLGQPRLADSRLAFDHGHAAVRRRPRVIRGGQPPPRRLPAHQRLDGAGGRGPGATERSGARPSLTALYSSVVSASGPHARARGRSARTHSRYWASASARRPELAYSSISRRWAARAAGRARAAARRGRRPRSSRPGPASSSTSRSSAVASSRRTPSAAIRCQSSNAALSRTANPASRSPRCRSTAAVSRCAGVGRGSASRAPELGQIEPGPVEVQRRSCRDRSSATRRPATCAASRACAAGPPGNARRRTRATAASR